jgi:1,3-beta-glucanosyltransferase GAS5
MVKLWTPALVLAGVLLKMAFAERIGGVAASQQNPIPPAAGSPPLPPQVPASAGAATVPLGQTQVAAVPPPPPPPATAANANANGAAANGSPPGQSSTSSTTSTQGKGTNPLVIKGYRFFDAVTGQYFGMRGVNYYPRPNAGALDANNLDFFTNQNQHIWGRDLPQFVALSANAIRLYAVDPDGDHTDFMCALQSAGIYVIVDLGSSCKGCEITPDKAPACYPASYKKRGEKIIQNFSKYDNVIGFSGGNEVNHRTGGNPPEWNAPCQKKFVRDMRAYIKSCPTMRQIPVGLVVADTNRDDNAQYYNCRTDPQDELENAEWYGINTYVHCGDSEDPAVGSGFEQLRQSFDGYKYSIPTVITEFGCTSDGFPTVNGFGGQRTFHDAKWMNQKRFSEHFNGGFVFEYSTENANSKSTVPYPFKTAGPQNYGLGYFTPESCDDVATPCEFVRFPNFDSLAMAYNSTDTSKEPTLQTFTPASDRTKPTTCPAAWPKLKDLQWEGDAAKSEACPQVARYQCPYVPIGQAKITLQETTSGDVSKQETGASPYAPIPDAKDRASNETSDQIRSGARVSFSSASLAAALASGVMVAVLVL